MAARPGWTGVTGFVIWCFCLFSQAEAGSYCYTNSYSTATYCSSGCCGQSGNEYCCNDELAWIIVGSVLGGIFLISVIVIVSCCVIKKKGKPGRVIQPQSETPPTQNIFVVYAGSPAQYPGPPAPYFTQPMGAQPMPPPGNTLYGTAATPNAPPAYVVSDPGYPSASTKA